MTSALDTRGCDTIEVNTSGYTPVVARDIPTNILGSGTYGVVYTGTVKNIDSETRVAIKKITVDRMFSETDLMMELSLQIFLRNEALKRGDVDLGYAVPEIYAAYVCYRNTSFAYVVMELWTGDVHSLLTGGLKKLKEMRGVKQPLYDLFCAVNSMHALNVVHNDLHSGNVFYMSTQRDPNVIDRFGIADFGLAEKVVPEDSRCRGAIREAPKIQRLFGTRDIYKLHTTPNDIFQAALSKAGPEILRSWGLRPERVNVIDTLLKIAPELDDFITPCLLAFAIDESPGDFLLQLLKDRGISAICKTELTVTTLRSSVPSKMGTSATPLPPHSQPPTKMARIV